MDWRAFFNRQESTIYSQTLPWIISRALIGFELFFFFFFSNLSFRSCQTFASCDVTFTTTRNRLNRANQERRKTAENHSRQTQTTSIIIFPLRNEMIKCLRGAHFLRFYRILFDCLRIFLIGLKSIIMYDFIKRVIQSCCMA